LLTPSPSLLQKRVSALGDRLGAATAPRFQLVPRAVSLQALFKLWDSLELYPQDILTYTELVLDSQGHLVQMNRVPGGNEVAGDDLGTGQGEGSLVWLCFKPRGCPPSKRFVRWLMQSPALTPFLWRSLRCDLVLFWGRWGWLLSK